VEGLEPAHAFFLAMMASAAGGMESGGDTSASASTMLACDVAGNHAHPFYHVGMSKSCICPKGLNHQTHRFAKSVKRVWRCADCPSVSFDERPEKCGACESARIVEDDIHFPEMCYCFTCKRHFGAR